MSALRFSSVLGEMTPYVPGASIEQVRRRFGLETVVKLASNEYPLPPFEEVKRAITAALDDLNRYPDGHAMGLREDVAGFYGCGVDQVIVGNGSCELIMLLGDVLLEPGDEVVLPQPSFSMYDTVCRRHRAAAVPVPLRDLALDLEAMAEAVSSRTKMVFVCNPNNPTGTYHPVAAVAEFVGSVPQEVLVVIDEAYNEFVMTDDWQESLALQQRHENVAILRTFSKAYGLCGLRVGYGIGAADLVAAIDTVRQPFNVNHLAQVAAREALRHYDQVLARRTRTVALRERLRQELEALGRRVAPSEANFVLVDVQGLRVPHEDVCHHLMAAGAVVRDGAALGCPGWVRVSVGTEEEIEHFLARLRPMLRDIHD